jgi:hypothetical protein
MIDARMGLRPWGAVRFAGAGALVLFLCWEHVQATRLGYRVESARREAAERRGRVESMRLELERRLSPSEVAARASRLGMIPAAPDALRRLPLGSTAGSSLGTLQRLLSRLPAPGAVSRG